MSADDYGTVRRDYGLDAAPVTKAGAPERRIWETTSVSPDPHKPGYFYATQRLAGEWRKRTDEEMWHYHIRGEQQQRGRTHGGVTALSTGVSPERYEELQTSVVWYQRSDGAPPVTRVLYCTFDERGTMQNAFKAASQGQVQP